MRTQDKRISAMTDREYCRYQHRMVRQQELHRKCVMIFMTFCLIVICTVSYHSLQTSANTGEDKISFKYYTNVSVKYGETVWDIADEYIDYNKYEDKNEYIAEVQNINHLDEECTVKAGQYLVVPYYSEEFK